MHDVRAGVHKRLRNQGFPIVTLGNASSTKFVDRFYELVNGCSYATSVEWGSQVAYCAEFGVPYFFMGKPPVLVNVSSPEMDTGEIDTRGADYELYDRADALFGEPVEVVTPEQREFVKSLLGMDSTLTPRQLSGILWRELVFHWRKLPGMIRNGWKARA
jgi:hypothetical protein